MVHDPVPGRGPLQGLATGLSAAAADGAETAFVAAVDLPHLHAAFVRAVLAYRVPPVEVALPVLDGHRQPLLAAYATALGARRHGPPRAGRTRPGALFAVSQVRELDAATLLTDPALAARDPELRAAHGVNTPEEWARSQGTEPTRADVPGSGCRISRARTRASCAAIPARDTWRTPAVITATTRRREPAVLAAATLAVGLGSGLGAVLFRYLILWFDDPVHRSPTTTARPGTPRTHLVRSGRGSSCRPRARRPAYGRWSRASRPRRAGTGCRR